MYFATRAAQYPISIYPASARAGLTVVIPLGIAVTAPAEAITSKLSWVTIASAIAVTAALVVINRWTWTRGLPATPEQAPENRTRTDPPHHAPGGQRQ